MGSIATWLQLRGLSLKGFVRLYLGKKTLEKPRVPDNVAITVKEHALTITITFPPSRIQTCWSNLEPGTDHQWKLL